MTSANGFAITITFPSGESDGLRVIEKLGWSGAGVGFPRTVPSEIRDNDVLQKPGVYILWEYGVEFPRVYIGQSENPSVRIYHHSRGDDKEFWTRAVVFSGGLDVAHTRYIEARLVEIAEAVKRCNRGADVTPQEPTLGAADKMHAENFLENMLLCLPIVGATFFERPNVPPQVRGSRTPAVSETPSSSDQEGLVLTGRFGVDARGYNGAEFVVLAGSKASKTEHNSISAVPRVAEQRRELLRLGVLEDDGETLVFTQDYAFNSPSRASSVCLGRNSNGWAEWKNEKGIPLKEIK